MIEKGRNFLGLIVRVEEKRDEEALRIKRQLIDETDQRKEGILSKIRDGEITFPLIEELDDAIDRSLKARTEPDLIQRELVVMDSIRLKLPPAKL